MARGRGRSRFACGGGRGRRARPGPRGGGSPAAGTRLDTVPARVAPAVERALVDDRKRGRAAGRVRHGRAVLGLGRAAAQALGGRGRALVGGRARRRHRPGQVRLHQLHLLQAHAVRGAVDVQVHLRRARAAKSGAAALRRPAGAAAASCAAGAVQVIQSARCCGPCCCSGRPHAAQAPERRAGAGPAAEAPGERGARGGAGRAPAS